MAESTLRHIGFIVDGNRRWARARGLTTEQGHKQGFAVLKQMAYAAQERKIPYVSAFIFSTENWGRSKAEVDYLMRLFLQVFKRDMRQMIADGFHIVFLGCDDHVSPTILQAIKDTEAASKVNANGTTLALCFNYGGQREIADAARQLAIAAQVGKLDPQTITPQTVAQALYHPEIPPLDLVVRTSGEERISGFMLWRLAYAEFLFIKSNWPDMTPAMLDDCLAEYANRQRRFGK